MKDAAAAVGWAGDAGEYSGGDGEVGSGTVRGWVVVYCYLTRGIFVDLGGGWEVESGEGESGEGEGGSDCEDGEEEEGPVHRCLW